MDVKSIKLGTYWVGPGTLYDIIYEDLQYYSVLSALLSFIIYIKQLLNTRKNPRNPPLSLLPGAPECP